MEIEYYFLNWGDTVLNDYSWKWKTETLASGFGLIREWYEEPGNFNHILKGCIIDGQTFGILTAINNEIQLPGEFYLSQNYPNPFNPSTEISYSLKEDGIVVIKVFDVLGKEVAVLKNKFETAGSHNINFNAANLPSGIYFYRIITVASTGTSTSSGHSSATLFSETKKMLLLK